MYVGEPSPGNELQGLRTTRFQWIQTLKGGAGIGGAFHRVVLDHLPCPRGSLQLESRVVGLLLFAFLRGPRGGGLH